MEEVKDFCNYNNVCIVMLCETKEQSPPFEGSVRHCGFQHFDFLPIFGMAGEI